MPPSIWEALLDEEDINVLIRTLDRNPRYNPSI
jgi:hypothetical protein